MAESRIPLSHYRLKELLDYNPETGEFTWRHRRLEHLRSGSPLWRVASWNTQNAGKSAGRINSSGYVLLKIDNRMYRAHRVAWFHVHGTWPRNEIDHIDRNRANNRIANLREATSLENTANTAVRRDSLSQIQGVGFQRHTRKWVARIRYRGREYHLGYFETAEAASAAYRRAKREFHGEFAS